MRCIPALISPAKLASPELGVGPLQPGQLRPVVDDDVRMERVPPHEVLVAGLGRVENAALAARRDRLLVQTRGAQLREAPAPGLALDWKSVRLGQRGLGTD